MAFGRREVYDRRDEPRTDILRRASIVYGERGSKVNGLIRNISLSGFRFVTDLPVDLPLHVVLEFGNGESFGCEVVRDVNGTEFGLKFADMSQFGTSEAKKNIDAIYQITKSHSPLEVYDMMEMSNFFGDDELEQASRDYAAAYDRMIGLYRQRIFVPQ